MDIGKLLEFVTMGALIGLIVIHGDQVGQLITTVTKIFTNAAHVAAK